MTLPISEQIVQNVITTLRGITVAGGYYQDIGQVLRYTGSPSLEFTRWPSCHVDVDHDGKDDEADFNWQDCKLRLKIYGYVDDQADPGQALSLLAADIEKILAVDNGRAGLAEKTHVSDIDWIVIPQGVESWTGEVQMDIEIWYKHRRDNPADQTE